MSGELMSSLGFWIVTLAAIVMSVYLMISFWRGGHRWTAVLVGLIVVGFVLWNVGNLIEAWQEVSRACS